MTKIHPLAGKPAPPELLIDIPNLEKAYCEHCPDLGDPNQLVSFGTSGHRGTPLEGTFTEGHILAIAQAICDYRRLKGFTNPLFMGKDRVLQYSAGGHSNQVVTPVSDGQGSGRK